MENLKEKIIEFEARAIELELCLTYGFRKNGEVSHVDIKNSDYEQTIKLNYDEIYIVDSMYTDFNTLKFAVDLYDTFFVS